MAEASIEKLRDQYRGKFREFGETLVELEALAAALTALFSETRLKGKKGQGAEAFGRLRHSFESGKLLAARCEQLAKALSEIERRAEELREQEPPPPDRRRMVPCTGPTCGAMIFFDKKTPTNLDGTNHFGTCPDAGQFGRNKRAAK